VIERTATSRGSVQRVPARLAKWALTMSPLEATVARRGFAVRRPEVRARVEAIGQSFLYGYNSALDEQAPLALARRLDRLDSERRGFAYEGAAMGLGLLERVMPWRRGLVATFLAGPGGPHLYMMFVGLGWALAVMPFRLDAALARLDPLLRGLVMDGYGFYHGYFHWPTSIRRRRTPRTLRGYARRGFDQGLGRSLWFVEGAEVAEIARTIQTFPDVRRADLWSGVGLACAYAGGVRREEVRALAAAAGPYYAHLAQGVCFAAKARERAGNPAPHTDAVCDVICGMTSTAAGAIADRALGDVPLQDPDHAYEAWRAGVRRQFLAGRA